MSASNRPAPDLKVFCQPAASRHFLYYNTQNVFLCVGGWVGGGSLSRCSSVCRPSACPLRIGITIGVSNKLCFLTIFCFTIYLLV